MTVTTIPLVIGTYLKGDKGLDWKNAYSNTTQYLKDSAVSYNGSSYIALKDTLGNLPTDDEFWGVVASKGEQGLTGGQEALNLKQDLANKDDALLGANLVGDKGTTVSGSLALSTRRPRKVFSKLFSAITTPTHLRVVVLGDSLAGAKMLQIQASLDRRMGGINGSGVNTVGTGAGAGIATGGVDLTLSTATSVGSEVLQYQYWPTGLVTRIDNGGSALWVSGGTSPTFTDVKVYYIVEPNAGTLNLSVGGTVVATANAAGSTRLGVLSFTQAAGKAAVVTTATGASVRVLFVHAKNTTVSGVDIYQSMNRGGLLLSEALGTAQTRTIFQAALTDIAPDLITFEMDDDFGDSATNDAAFSLLTGILDASNPLADKLFFGSTPRNLNDSLKIRSGQFLKNYCSGRGADYLFFDSYYLLGSYAEMDAIFGIDDGTHPVPAAQAYAAEILWCQLGLDGFNLGFSSRAVNDRGTPSAVARGTTIGDGPGKQITFQADASTGSDHTLQLTRSFGVLKSDGTTVLSRVSAQPTVISNVTPMTTDFDSAANTRKRSLVTSTGIEITQLVKTDNPGGMQHLRAGLFFNSFTRAQLLAITAVGNIGALAYCSDCTGGAQWVYARGRYATDWVTVDGKTAI